MLAFMMPTLVFYQIGELQLAGGNEKDEAFLAYKQVYGHMFRGFGHCLLHGFFQSLFIAFPVITINCLFEQKSFRYATITSGYWIVVITIIGAVIYGWK